MNARKTCIFLCIALCLGAAAGAVIWALLYIMNQGIALIWTSLPGWLSWKWLPIPVCALGGLLIGLWSKRFGDYPEDLHAVMGKVKTTGGYPYDKLGVIAVAALLPLVFGASLGPEAGLTGVIAGICTAVGAKFKRLLHGMEDLPRMGLIAALGVIFREPLFGLVFPIEPSAEEDHGLALPKGSKIAIYLAATLGALGIYLLLSALVGGGMALGRFADVRVALPELLALLPLSLAGVLAGAWYHLCTKLTRKLAAPLARKKRTVTLAIAGGLLLGLSGVLLPYTMFAGEHQMTEIQGLWQSMGWALLTITCFVKLLLTNLCIASGWRGGNIFPVIFSGVCLGYALASIAAPLGINATFCVAAVAASLCGTVMRKPIAVALLLLLCFPVAALLPMIVAAFIGGAIPLPKALLPAPPQAATPDTRSNG